MFLYDTRVQQFTQTVDVLSFNGLTVHVSVSCRYQPVRSELPNLHHEIGPDYEKKTVIPILLAAVREVIGNYRPEELYTTHSATIQAEINRVALEGIQRMHVTYLPILVSSISLPGKVNLAIEEKLKQQQEAQAYEFRLARESQEKERLRIEAEGIQQHYQIISEQLKPSVLAWLDVKARMALALSDNTKVLVMDTNRASQVQLPLRMDDFERSRSDKTTTEQKPAPDAGVTPSEAAPVAEAAAGAAPPAGATPPPVPKEETGIFARMKSAIVP